jgi:hypothetical protein
MTTLGPTFQWDNSNVELLGDKAGVQERIAMRWDIRFVKRVEETHGKELLVIATYERNSNAAADRADDHFAEVYKVLKHETAGVIRVVDSNGIALQYPKAYVDTAYDVYVLGKYQKGAEEIESLIKQQEVQYVQ